MAFALPAARARRPSRSEMRRALGPIDLTSMFSEVIDQLLAVAIYAALATSVAFGRPPIPRRGRGASTRVERSGEKDPLEPVWLGALAVVGLYPLGVSLAPATLRSSPFAYSFPGDEVVQIVGLASVLLGGALVAAAFRALGRFATVRIEISRDHTIVRGGPYRRIRHPIYTANLLWTAGIALAFLSTFLWIPVVAIAFLAHDRAVREERNFLSSDRLAGAYAEYMGSSGRFFPRLRSRSPRRP